MRRIKQQISEADCIRILREEKRGVLSMLGDDGYPYGIPLNHWYNPEDGKIYFHGAKTGHKIDAIRRCGKASFCVYDQGIRQEGEWFLRIRSVIVFGRIELIEHKLAEDSTLDGLSLAEIYKRTNIRFLICAVQRDSKIFVPTGDFILRAGDRINIAASHKDLERFFRMCGALKDKIKSVMIVGGGKICYYLSRQLLSLGMRVKIIEQDYARCTELAELLPKALVIHGDGTDQELLQEEGIDDADSFVAITGIDEENIIMSLYAKMNTNAKVVTKVNRDSYVNLASQIGLDTVISPKYITTSNILSYVRSQSAALDSNIESLYHLVSNKVEAIEFKVRENIPGVVGIKLAAMELKKNILICAIVRKRDIIIPSGMDTIEIGDSVVVVCKEHRISELRDILL